MCETTDIVGTSDDRVHRILIEELEIKKILVILGALVAHT